MPAGGNHSYDEAKLTAYALGELDEAESREVREQILGDDAANEHVRGVRETADAMRAALSAEPTASDAEVTTLHVKRADRTLRKESPKSAWRFVNRYSLAASLLIVTGVYFVTGWLFEPQYAAPAPDPSSVPLATLIEATPGGSLTTPGGFISEGSDYPGGEYSLEQGTAEFMLADGTHIKLEGKSSMRLGADGRIVEQSGTVIVNGAPSNAPVAPLIDSTGTVIVNNDISNPGGFTDPHEHHPGHNSETYQHLADNRFTRVADAPLSTFSIDVDTASYANVRRMLKQGQRPPVGAVRIEEFINYFSYSYPDPVGPHPIASHVETAACPWAPTHRLVRVGVQAKRMHKADRPPSNLVFLLDVSGSMSAHNKLPLLKESMKMLVSELDERDSVAIVVYAGASGLVLPSTPAGSKDVIYAALDRLSSGGSTAGASGIRQAYSVATQCFVKGGVNRVILATDGDFNVGVSSDDALVELIEQKRKSGVYLSILGFGMGNYKDAKMEKLSNAGNGNYAYIDTKDEARKALVEGLAGTLVTVAKDVKVQIEFNPAVVASYRLIGYENRMLAKEDFNDDTKDAGEVGAGHSVTALYEIVPVGAVPMRSTQQIDAEIQAIRTLMAVTDATGQWYDAQLARIAQLEAERARVVRLPARPAVDPLKYQPNAQPGRVPVAPEMLTVKMRYKLPDSDTSTKLEQPIRDAGAGWNAASHDMRFAASVASFGMILRQSPHRGSATLNDVHSWAATAEQDRASRDAAADPYRTEFIELIGAAMRITTQR